MTSCPVKSGDETSPVKANGLAEFRSKARTVTPARVFLEGPGSSYSTADLLHLRADHAAARDAVSANLEIDDPALSGLVMTHGLYGVTSSASSLHHYLTKPHLGRQLDERSRAAVAETSEGVVDLQIVLGDGLSPRAVAQYAPEVFELLVANARTERWSIARPIFVARCRVGIMNEIGELSRSAVVVLLIGERPGLANGRSMSAYLGYRPKPGQTDADRNLICNIHDDGVSGIEAAQRVFELAQRMKSHQLSGVALKEVATTGGYVR